MDTEDVDNDKSPFDVASDTDTLGHFTTRNTSAIMRNYFGFCKRTYVYNNILSLTSGCLQLTITALLMTLIFLKHVTI